MEDIYLNQKLKKFYDEYDNKESEWRRLSAIDKVYNIIALCSKYPHKTILEIGSGDGSILKRLSDLRFAESLYSLEISETAIETIHQRNIESLIECTIFNGYNIPYDNDKFDLVILSHVIEHLEYPRKILYEAGRVANFVFVEVPLEDNKRLNKTLVSNKVGHINFYSTRTIRKLIQTCDLTILAQKVTHPSYQIYNYQYGKKGIIRYLFKKLVLQLMPNLATNSWTYNCPLLCTKGRIH
jgi:2-polyprenyl-3-methyl-5-hydroxy-6-metoxy-1,4-benzoquinol methylase